MRKRRVMMLVALVSAQMGIGVITTALIITNAPATAAASSHNILVGPGFTDVSPHQLVRTSADILYTLAPTCDSYNNPPTINSCLNNSLRLYRADQPGSPASCTEQDTAHRPSGNIGSAALAVDGSDTLHAAWIDHSGSDSLNYRTFSTATNLWSATTQIDTTHWTTFGQGDEGVALALDANGIPHVAYTTVSTNVRRVAYANKIGGTWSSPTLVDDASFLTNQGAWHPTLAFYPNGDLLLAWLVGASNYTADGTIYFRTRNHTSGMWGVHTMIAGDTLMTTIDNGPSLLITADGTAHVTFLNAGTATDGSGTAGDYVHYYYNSGAGWVANHPGGGTQITHDPSLGPGPDGGVRIYGHGWQGGRIDGHGDNLNYFAGGGGAASWGVWTLYVSGSYDCSVSTRWAQFFQAHPEEMDIAYWADAYPNTLYVGSDNVGGGTPTATPTPTPTPTATAPPAPQIAPLPPPRDAQTGSQGFPAAFPQQRSGPVGGNALPGPYPSPR